jgi:antitoxin (DNA-binding transcriptional repressor) of toxin-antitoxin stability system
VLERVRRTGTSVLVTRRGVPVAEIIPPTLASTGAGWLGAMRGSASLSEDLVDPASEERDWDALRA